MRCGASDWVRYDRIVLRNCGPFRGTNVFTFPRDRTVIVGACGAGKSTLASALAGLGVPPAIAVNDDGGEAEVVVTTAGNRDLLLPHRQLIHVDPESAGRRALPDWGALLHGQPNPEQIRRLESDTTMIFGEIIAGKVPAPTARCHRHRAVMSTGELVCHGYAIILAARDFLGLDLPLVMDSPFSHLDPALRIGLRKVLARQGGQQVLLLGQTEQDLDDRPDYVLAPGHENR